jgi:uncharacterized membrane protein HdeD (DUF308 family)
MRKKLPCSLQHGVASPLLDDAPRPTQHKVERLPRIDPTSTKTRLAAQVWWLILAVGVLSTAAGVVAVLRPSHSLATVAVVVGIFVLIDGVAELVGSFRSEENRALAAILGVLGIVVGILLIRHPLHGVAAIGLLIGIWLLTGGVIRLLRALALGVSQLLLQVFIAVVEIAAGLVIVADPHAGLTTLAVIVGIWLIVNGIGMVALAAKLRTVDTEPASAVGQAPG